MDENAEKNTLLGPARYFPYSEVIGLKRVGECAYFLGQQKKIPAFVPNPRFHHLLEIVC